MKSACFAALVGASLLPWLAIAGSAQAQDARIRYQCEQGPSFDVHFHQNQKNNIRDYARVQLPNQPEPLKLRPLDSRDDVITYGSGKTVLTIRDNQASLEQNWLPISNGCVAQ
jgi:hypothetical protein